MKMISNVLILFLLSLNSGATPARIFLIRHAEKPMDSNDPNLSPVGFQRAQALAQLFQIHPEYADKGLPTALFAARYVPGDTSNRSVQTVTPLSHALGLNIQTPFVGSDFLKLADLILNQAEFNNKVIFIAWVHGKIPKLAKALNGNCPDVWEDQTFDRIWMINYGSAQAECLDLPQSVLPNDSK